MFSSTQFFWSYIAKTFCPSSVLSRINSRGRLCAATMTLGTASPSSPSLRALLTTLITTPPLASVLMYGGPKARPWLVGHATRDLESHCCRLANADSYCQQGTKMAWNRYVTLGYYIFDDCTVFDKHWATLPTDTIFCRCVIWFNFMYHVDRKLNIPPILQAWATGISQPYLNSHSSKFLQIDTMLQTPWSELINDTTMNVDSADQWMEVPGKTPRNVRDCSPPLSSKVAQFHTDPIDQSSSSSLSI